MVADEPFYSDLEADYGAMTLTFCDLHVIGWSALVGILNDHPDFLAGPFERFRRWRSVLKKLRVFFRAVKRVRQRYAEATAAAWEERGARVEAPEGCGAAALTRLMVRRPPRGRHRRKPAPRTPLPRCLPRLTPPTPPAHARHRRPRPPSSPPGRTSRAP